MVRVTAIRQALGPDYADASDREIVHIVVSVLRAVRTPTYKQTNAAVSELHSLAVEYVKRERAGSSASMNGALDYGEITVYRAMIDALIEEVTAG